VQEPDPGYTTRLQSLTFGSRELSLQSLLDTQQFHDPDQVAEKLGVSPSQWSIFGVLWPSACVLAERMTHINFRGRRVLEVGSGLGLASLVAQSRHANITASDHHPLSQLFLDGNTTRNQMGPIPFHQGNWSERNQQLGLFGLIVASDVLYEGNHAELLSGFIDHHAEREVEVLVVDASRGHQNNFARRMKEFGYVHTFEHPLSQETQAGHWKGKIHTFLRAI
jgi:predicted nicotinamide N-methyase